MEVIIAFIFLSLGLSRWINKIALKSKKRIFRNLIYILLYLLFTFLLSLPFSIYTGFIREHQYGLSNITFMEWFSEEMIGLALLIFFGGLLLLALYSIIKKVKNTWWIWGSGVLMVFLIITIFISPVFISPLFNNYVPLEDGEIKEEILSLARANGVPADNVYQFNASKQSKRISANVSGIGSTIRISLNDNLLNQCSKAEIKSVMAHELGHYVLNHTITLLIYFGIIIVIGFAVVNFLMKKAINKFGAGWGIENISDVTSLPLFVILFSFYMFIATPVTNSIIRSDETEADIFGLNAAREPDGFASVAMKLSDYRKINPGKLEEILFFDHPSGNSRVTMSMKWKAENLEK